MSATGTSAPERTDRLRLTVVAIRPETRDVKTFVFAPDGGVPPYAAGQSMTLDLEVEGERLMRTFSLSSAPDGSGTISMTIKAQANGRATRWLHDRLAVGDRLTGQPPRGRFTLAAGRADRIALISAGSGAAPLMGMLRHLAATAPDSDVAWLHAARGPADVLFAEELAALQGRMPNLRVAVTVSRPVPGWFGFTGRLGRRLVSVAVPDLGRREAFCCGPAGFMEEARLIHAAEGGARDRFHIERFAAASPVASPPLPEVPDAGFAVMLGEKRFTARPGETLLQAATRHAVVIPCGCAAGLCGTCRVSLVSGSVAMQHEGGLSPDEEARGYILACSSRPSSDVTIAL